MTELEKGPRGLRRGRGARERILSASQQLFRDQGINRTGMDQLCAVAQVSKRTASNYTGRPDFPEPIERLEMGPVWRRVDVEAWAKANLPLPPGRPPKRDET